MAQPVEVAERPRKAPLRVGVAIPTVAVVILLSTSVISIVLLIFERLMGLSN